MAVDGVTRALAPGEQATVPVGALHHFANPTPERTVFHVELRPRASGLARARAPYPPPR